VNAFIDLHSENAASLISVNLVALSKDNSVTKVRLKAPAAITTTTAGITTIAADVKFPTRLRESAEKMRLTVTSKGDCSNPQTSRVKAEGWISFTVTGRITLSRGTLANASF
jgi:hypothetical protein